MKWNFWIELDDGSSFKASEIAPSREEALEILVEKYGGFIYADL